MDRNAATAALSAAVCAVALRKESVDRNLTFLLSLRSLLQSLSARRAWIEIYNIIIRKCYLVVALRKESVDRNPPAFNVFDHNMQTSLSARRAWIEIRVWTMLAMTPASRSPQGERG